MLLGIKIAKGIAKLNETISATSKKNKIDIIQRLRNEEIQKSRLRNGNLTLQNRVGQFGNRWVSLLEKALIDNEIKFSSAYQYNRRSNTETQGISQSVKYTHREKAP